MIRNLITSSLLRVPCISTEKPRTHQTLQGQVLGHLGGGIETVLTGGTTWHPPTQLWTGGQQLRVDANLCMGG